MRRTKWFPAHIKPVNVGVYEIRLHSDPQVVVWCRWDGHAWRAPAANKWVAANSQGYAFASYPWRGLAERYKT